MKIKIIGGDRRVAVDGHTIQVWPDGSMQHVTEAFAAPLIRDGWAVNAEVLGPTKTPTVAPSETKVVEPDEAKADPKADDAPESDDDGTEARQPTRKPRRS